MKLEVKKRISVVPANLEQPKKYKIDIDEDVDDTVKETERQSSNGGNFKQYSLFLEDEDGVKCEANYLFQRDLNAVGLTYGENTKDWSGQWVELSKSDRQVGDKIYQDLVIKPVGLPESQHEKV